MNDFFKRILQLSENKGFKNISDFAKSGLLYASSEKINRLKKENNKPSFEILLDISNKFEDVNLNWLITGRGKMEIDEDAIYKVGEQNSSYSNSKDSDLIKSKDKIIELLEAEILRMKNEIVQLQGQDKSRTA
ncbi:hypothetical protein ACFX5D_04200 [Flavobacterium sp. LB3P45]|uniref:Bacteriophage CI repressor helix-turn-helix domain-containing protein n=1 Tax=Flavobacterium fructosi TaxID=3230416 RepID=A0ABW6HJG3_9FLAO